jgi:hypothetical protein
MDKTRFSGTTRTKYKKRPYDNITLRPPIPAKPEDGQRAEYDLGSFTSGPPNVLPYSALAVGVFHCDNIKETLD